MKLKMDALMLLLEAGAPKDVRNHSGHTAAEAMVLTLAAVARAGTRTTEQ